MNVEQVWLELQELPKLIVKINQRDKQAVGVLDGLSRKIFGEPVKAGCSNCHIKAYHKLTALTYQNLLDMSARQFKLSKGITIEYPLRGGRFYNSDTITDDIAKGYLINNPAAIKEFSDYPKNGDGTPKVKPEVIDPLPIEEEVKVVPADNDAEPAEEDIHDMKKPELQEKYKEVLGEYPDDKLTKAELLKAIEAK